MSSKQKVMLPKTKVIELRQNNRNAQIMSGDGDYKVILDNPVIVREGDQIILRSAFVDTAQSNENLIKIKPDPGIDPVTGKAYTYRTISFTNGFYLNNIPSSLETPNKVPDGGQTDADNQRLVISKIYDPGLGCSGTGEWLDTAGVGLAAPSSLFTPASLTADGRNALNVRMTGTNYIAYEATRTGGTGVANHTSRTGTYTLTMEDAQGTAFTKFKTTVTANSGVLILRIISYKPGPNGANDSQREFGYLSINGVGAPPNGVGSVGNFFTEWTGSGAGGGRGLNSLILSEKLLTDYPVLLKGSDFPFLEHGVNNQSLVIQSYNSVAQQAGFGNVVPPSNFTLNTNNFNAVVLSNAVDINTDVSVVPLKRTTRIRIPAQEYQAEELAIAVTNKITSLTSEGIIPNQDFYVANNGVLLTSRQMTFESNSGFTALATAARSDQQLSAAGSPTPPANTIGADFYNDCNITNPIIFADRGELIGTQNVFDTFRMNDLSVNTQNYVIGAQDCSILWDDERSKYEIGKIHTPLYDINFETEGARQIRQYSRANVAAVAAAGAVPAVTAEATKKIWVNKYSGIYFTDWDTEFFEDILKFSKNVLVTFKDVPNAVNRKGEAIKISVPAQPFEDGVNTTGEIDTISATIHNLTEHFPAGTDATSGKLKPSVQNADGGDAGKTAGINHDARSSYDIYDIATSNAPLGAPSPLAPAYFPANENQQISIFSTEHIGPGFAEIDDPYYKIEVKSHLLNELEGDPTLNRHISSIISKYYNAGSFTTAYGEGSIPYTHKGADVVITDFSVRILTSDGVLATDINDRNTIFLELTTSQ